MTCQGHADSSDNRPRLISSFLYHQFICCVLHQSYCFLRLAFITQPVIFFVKISPLLDRLKIRNSTKQQCVGTVLSRDQCTHKTTSWLDKSWKSCVCSCIKTCFALWKIFSIYRIEKHNTPQSQLNMIEFWPFELNPLNCSNKKIIYNKLFVLQQNV